MMHFMTDRRTLNDKVKRFMEVSNLHGLQQIVRSRTWKEWFFYTFMVVACNGATIYGCYQIVHQYWERPLATSYFIEDATSLSLPDITICPFNRLDKQFLDDNNITNELGLFIEWAFFLVNPKYSFSTYKTPINNFSEINRLQDQLNQKLAELNLTFDQFVVEASFSCPDLVRSCSVSFQDTDCCNHSTAVLNSMGQCFRLHTGNQSSAGFGNGVVMEIRLPIDRYFFSENMLLNDGLLIKLTERGRGYEFDAIFLQPGIHALLQLWPTKLEFMNDVGRYTCIDDASESYAPLGPYTRLYCS